METAVAESRERIESALLNSGFGYPDKAVTINLAPANVRKEGAGFDTPMAVGIVGAMGMAPKANGHLPAHANRLSSVIVPRENAAEAAVVDGVRVFGMQHLSEVIALLKSPDQFTPASSLTVLA